MKFNLSIKDMTLIGMCSALMAIFSQISIPNPFSTVPLTLQTFGVILIAIILEHKLGTISIIIWTLLGAIGIPVFAGFSGGIGSIVGPTGGYILGFSIMAFIIGYAASKDNKILLFCGAYLGQIVLYVCGIIQLKIVLGLTFSQALVAGLYPFILKGVIEVAFATIAALAIKKYLYKARIINANL